MGLNFESTIPDVDAYGNWGRTTNLADFLEYRTMLHEPMLLSELLDMVLDLGYETRSFDLIRIGQLDRDSWDRVDPLCIDDSKLLSGEDEILWRVLGVLKERQRFLGDKYPFIFDGEGKATRLRLKQDGELCRVYLSLLAITLAHASNRDVGDLRARTVEDAFEYLAAQILGDYGIPSRVLETQGGSVQERMISAAEEIGLRPNPGLATFSRHANDGGTDLVCHLPDCEQRPFPGFVLLGQATCGQTHTWRDKSSHPNVDAWRKSLNLGYGPFVFLAVPHHMDNRLHAKMNQDCSSAVFDRVKLVSMSSDTTPDGETILREVFERAPQ